MENMGNCFDLIDKYFDFIPGTYVPQKDLHDFIYKSGDTQDHKIKMQIVEKVIGSMLDSGKIKRQNIRGHIVYMGISKKREVDGKAACYSLAEVQDYILRKFSESFTACKEGSVKCDIVDLFLYKEMENIIIPMYKYEYCTVYRLYKAAKKYLQERGLLQLDLNWRVYHNLEMVCQLPTA